MALEYLNDLMWRSTQLFGASGIAAVAQSGIDLALWDLKGRILNQPVYKLFGGPSREKVALYCTSDDLDWSKELGFRAFKISNPVNYEMGVEGLELLEEKIAKAREEVGASAELMFNPVMSFNVEFTLRLAERLRPYGLRWLEEPLIPSDLEGHIELKRAITWIPLATGEHHHRRQAFRQLVENRAVDIVQPDITCAADCRKPSRFTPSRKPRVLVQSRIREPARLGDSTSELPCPNRRWQSSGWVRILASRLKKCARFRGCRCP